MCVHCVRLIPAAIALLVALQPSAFAASPPLPIPDHTVGLDPMVFHGPQDAAWTDDGECFVLNFGSKDVVVLGPDWRELRRFGREGDGPGELTIPRRMDVIDDQIHIRQLASLEVFAFDGTFVRRDRLTEFGNHVLIGNVDISLNHQRQASTLTWSTGSDGAHTVQLPPSHVMFWEIIGPPVDDGLTLAHAVDRFDGLMYEIGHDGSVGPERDVGLGRGIVQGGGGRPVLITICTARDLGYWALSIPEPDGEEHLLLLSPTLEHIADWTLGDIKADQIALSPRGEFCLVSSHGSVMYVFDEPPYPGRR